MHIHSSPRMGYMQLVAIIASVVAASFAAAKAAEPDARNTRELHAELAGRLTDHHIELMIGQALPRQVERKDALPAVREALSTHVRQMLDAGPIMPLPSPTGGSLTWSFIHPRERFLALSMALPYLNEPVGKRVIEFLDAELDERGPLGDSNDALKGEPRVPGGAYDAVVRPNLELEDPTGEPTTYDGLYALWAYCHYADRPEAAKRMWPDIVRAFGQCRQRMERALRESPAAESHDSPTRRPQPDIVRINRGIGAALATARLAKMTGHEATEAEARDLLKRLVADRLGWSFAKRSYWLPFRGEMSTWYDLPPEMARLLGQIKGEAIQAYMTGQPVTLRGRYSSQFNRNNFWHLAWTDGCQIAETAIAYPQYNFALFAIRAQIFQDSGGDLARLADMPWCAGDLYYMRKLALTLWAADGRHWESTGTP